MRKSKRVLVIFCVMAISLFCVFGATACGNILNTDSTSSQRLTDKIV